MQFNITFKTIFEYILKKVVLCIQIHFVSTEKTTRIASRASCYFKLPTYLTSVALAAEPPRVTFCTPCHRVTSCCTPAAVALILTLITPRVHTF